MNVRLHGCFKSQPVAHATIVAPEIVLMVKARVCVLMGGVPRSILYELWINSEYGPENGVPGPVLLSLNVVL